MRPLARSLYFFEVPHAEDRPIHQPLATKSPLGQERIRTFSPHEQKDSNGFLGRP